MCNELGKYPVKQEEVAAIIVAAYEVVFFHGYLFAPTGEFALCTTILGLLALSCILIRHNKNTYQLYKMKKGGSEILRAKIVNEKSYADRSSVYLSIRFKILDTGELFDWKESYSMFITDGLFLGEEINQFLFKLPEVDVVVDPNDHNMHYVLLPPITDSVTYTHQRAFAKLNIALLFLLVILCIIVYLQW